MGLLDLFTSYKKRSNKDFQRRFGTELRENIKFRNLDSGNRAIVMQLFDKYDRRIRDGRGISSYNLRNEMHQLYKNRISKNLSENDLDDIRDILENFKK